MLSVYTCDVISVFFKSPISRKKAQLQQLLQFVPIAGSQRVLNWFSRGSQRVLKGFSKGSQLVLKGFSKGSQLVLKGFATGSQGVPNGFSTGSQRVLNGFSRGSQRVPNGLPRPPAEENKQILQVDSGLFANPWLHWTSWDNLQRNCAADSRYSLPAFVLCQRRPANSSGFPLLSRVLVTTLNL